MPTTLKGEIRHQAPGKCRTIEARQRLGAANTGHLVSMLRDLPRRRASRKNLLRHCLSSWSSPVSMITIVIWGDAEAEGMFIVGCYNDDAHQNRFCHGCARCLGHRPGAE